MTDGQDTAPQGSATPPISPTLLPPMLNGIPIVSGFTPEDESGYDTPLQHYVPEATRYEEHNTQAYTQFAKPEDYRDTPLEPLRPRLENPLIDPITSEAFSPDIVDAQLHAERLQALAENPVVNTWADSEAWRDPATVMVLSDPAHKPGDPYWKAKLIAGRKIGVKELLFGRIVSPGSIAVVCALAILCGLLGGYIGRITGTTQVQLTTSYPQLKTDPSLIETDDAVENVARTQSPTIVQIIASTPTVVSFGSGVIVDKQGYIWTKNHVIMDVANDKHPDIKVVFRDKTRADARIVGRDEKSDVAVLKVEVNNLSVATIGDSDTLAQGQRVVAIGAPLRHAQSVSSGVVSALHFPWSGTEDLPMIDDCIQTDTAINEGNSGGGLFDLKGRLIGITNGQEVDPNTSSAGSIGINFAISINFFAKVARSIEEHGSYVHPWSGLSVSSVVRQGGSGAKVINIAASSPAQQAGLRENDVIISVNNTDISNAAEFYLAVEQLTIGKAYPVEFIRDNHHLKTTITPDRAKT